MKTPDGLKYSKTDEWVKVDGNIATIGITDYAQDSLSDIVFVEILSNLDDILQKGENCATLESVKAAADVHLPVSGKVIATNDKLPDSPEKVNISPYEDAWMVRLIMTDTAELDQLMDSTTYIQFCEERGH
jgi:glycine cleavage system H protein